MHSSAEKFQTAALALGYTLNILEYPAGTRTAEDAANAIGCAVGQIVKSLCFTVNGTPVIALVSGDNMLDVKKIGTLMGVSKKKIKRANAETVKAATGYTIGGVPPFGHSTQMTTFIDTHLTTFPVIWAAAGTPHAVFECDATMLQQATGGTIADLKRD